MFSDEYIEHWGNEFEARELWRYGILFESFLNFPHEILSAVVQRAPLIDEKPLIIPCGSSFLVIFDEAHHALGAEADVSHVNMEVAS